MRGAQARRRDVVDADGDDDDDDVVLTPRAEVLLEKMAIARPAGDMEPNRDITESDMARVTVSLRDSAPKRPDRSPRDRHVTAVVVVVVVEFPILVVAVVVALVQTEGVARGSHSARAPAQGPAVGDAEVTMAYALARDARPCRLTAMDVG